jgi:hypothetical protein
MPSMLHAPCWDRRLTPTNCGQCLQHNPNATPVTEYYGTSCPVLPCLRCTRVALHCPACSLPGLRCPDALMPPGSALGSAAGLCPAWLALTRPWPSLFSAPKR